MKLLELKVSNYRSLRQESIPIEDLNVFIGANGSGKSTILDVLRFLNEGLGERDFREPVRYRGGLPFLSWRGGNATEVDLSVKVQDASKQVSYIWSIGLTAEDRRFSISEKVFMQRPDGSSDQLLSVNRGVGWWMSGEDRKVEIEQDTTMCALAVASTDVGFPAREVFRFISNWGFIDPNLFSLRRTNRGPELDRLHNEGRNLAERLYRIKESSPETFDKIASATRSVLGTPDRLDSIEDQAHGGRYHLHFHEKGLKSPISQRWISSGTLRVLTLMTALLEDHGGRIVAIEEPENNIHPAALMDFVQYLIDASRQVQILITTHSPTLLNFMEDPASVNIVRRDEVKGTKVIREKNPGGVRLALQESGFSLGEFHETKGFGR